MNAAPAQPRPLYVVQIRPGPDCRVPDEVALRRLLKVLARVYGLECMGAWEVTTDAVTTERQQSFLEWEFT